MKIAPYLLAAFVCCLLLGIGTSSEGQPKKVKCKEHIDAALKQYWDHEKGKLVDINDADDDNDSEEHVTAHVVNAQANGHHAVVESEEEDDDNDDDNDTKESIEPHHHSEEDTEEDNDSNETHEESDEKDAKKITKSEEDDDDKSDEKVHSKKEIKTKNDEKDEKDDESNESEEDDKKSKSTKSKKPVESEEDDDSEEEKIEIKKHSKKSKSSKKVVHEKDDDDEDDDDDDDDDDHDHDNVEDNKPSRSRDHIEQILRLDEIGTKEDQSEQNLVVSIYRELKKIFENAIKPLEQLYKFRSISNRLISDAEIFAKPLVVFLGAKSSGKSTLINYLLGLQKTEWALPTAQPASPQHFTILSHGKEYSKQSSIEFASDLTFSTLQQFGDKFIEQRVEAYRMPLDILQRMTIVDCPSLVETPQKSGENPLAADAEVYQWLFDRSDVIYLTLDVNQLQVSTQMQTILEQLKGRDVRFILNKVDTVKHSELILLIGQLFWLLSPLMPADRPPQVYALTTQPLSDFDYFLDGQEQQWLSDMREQVIGVQRVQSRIGAVRRHALRVRNHAKLVDCYLAAYYRTRGLFTYGQAAKQLAAQITSNPQDYHIFQAAQRATEPPKYGHVAALGGANVRVNNDFNVNTVNKALQAQNGSRFDLPDAHVYKAFFGMHNLLDFQPLSDTCSFFRGCPIDKLDMAIAYQLPNLLVKYRKDSKLSP